MTSAAVNNELLELNTLIERLHNPYYTTKDIVDAVLYLLHRERNQQLAFEQMCEYQNKTNSINNLNEDIEDEEYRNNKTKEI